MIKAVIFDFDGVLFESVDVKTKAFQALFRKESPADVDKITHFHLANGGMNRWDKITAIYGGILRRPLSNDALEEHCNQFAEIVVQKVVEAPWVEGAKEFLDTHQKTYRYFVVSATPDQEIKHIVKRKAIGHYFEDVLGSPRKKDVLLREVLQQHALTPRESVYVGDSINDWQAAVAVPLPFVWRRANQKIAPLPGYKGPTITTLRELNTALLGSLLQ